MKNRQAHIFAIFFPAMIAIISIMSCYKLLRFYVNDEIDYNEWNASFAGRRVETDYISNFWNKYQYVNLNGYFENLMGHQEMNGVIKMNNGYLMTVMAEKPDEQICVDNTVDFKEKLEEQGIKYFYVTVPYVVDKYDNQLPIGIKDYGNVNLDKIEAAMRAGGIAGLDLRETMHDEGYSTYDWFYRTDHHWTTQGGFYAYQKIVEYLEESMGFEIDEKLKEMDNYTITTYEKWHL